MRIVKLSENIFHFVTDSQYELCSSFLRPEEFYESPFADIQGQFFTLDKFMDKYAESKNGVFTYFDDWAGFNIPGDSLIAFHSKFCTTFTDKEKFIFDAIEGFIRFNNKNFFIMATLDNSVAETNRHELAHGLYYLDTEYRVRCDLLYYSMPENARDAINTRLLDDGYALPKLKDECQAYLSTSQIGEIMSDFHFTRDTVPLNIIVEYQDHFNEKSANIAQW
jgi:hypothetical protein